MKKNVLLFIFFVISTTMFSQISRSDVKKLLRDKGYTIATERYAYLTKGDESSFNREFYKNNDYIIIAYSEDYGMKDIDIRLYDTDDTLLEKDTRTNGYAIIHFSPSYSRTLKIVIKNYDSESSIKEYNCKFIVAYK